MRALLAAVAVAAMVFAGIPAGASEFTPPGEEYDSISGTIALPTRFTNGAGGWPGLVRRAYQASAASNGVIGFVFDVDPETWGGAFVLGDVTDQTGTGQLDIFFYEEMGDAGGQVAGVTTGEYQSPSKGEIGFVPEGSRKGIVFTPDAVNAAFNYTVYTPPVIEIGKDALDLTVPAGASVVWRNTTADYTYVRHTPASGAPAFNSSPKAGTGIRVGDTFTHIFDAPGTYTYQTANGASVLTGTITVTDGPGVGPPAG